MKPMYELSMARPEDEGLGWRKLDQISDTTRKTTIYVDDADSTAIGFFQTLGAPGLKISLDWRQNFDLKKDSFITDAGHDECSDCRHARELRPAIF